MKTPTVVNKYKEPSFDIYIGRGSYWGNPFPINDSVGHTREVVIEMYRDYLRELYSEDKQKFMLELSKLDGKVLGCFCKPKPCHGDVIIQVFDILFKEK